LLGLFFDFSKGEPICFQGGNFMMWLFGTGLALVLIFSISVALYLVNYAFPLKGVVIRTVLFFLISTITFGLVFSLVIFMVWPPHIWDLIAF